MPLTTGAADNQAIETLAINTIRTLSMDAVQAANSGHPGAPMALAPLAYYLWQRRLRYDPADPIWPNRDRFVLSNGHASMLLYSMLHLTGVKTVSREYIVRDEPAVSLDEIKRFRQLDSKCPGHPEYRLTSGVETTTGPLGQGVGNSVGMAIAGKWLANHFNRPGFELFTYDVYAICGDGDMMEGVSNEAASLAGHLKLSNLCWLYDNNQITIEGRTSLAFSEDVATRFRGLGWNVTHVSDANDLAQLELGLSEFKRTLDRPTLIIVDSHIAWGSPNKQDTHGAHGEPLGEEEVRLTKRAYGWPEEAKFLVPDGVREHFQQGIGVRGRGLREQWAALFKQYQAQFPELADQLERMQRRQLPDGWDKGLPTFPADPKGKATRDSNAAVLNVVAQNVPWLIGGAADLAPSTKTRLTFTGAGDINDGNFAGRNMHFGIREHGMGAILNGMSLCKIRPYGSGFLIFSDYGRGALRLGAISEIPVIYIFTHDSIGVGEDGPTHQPIEHLASLRTMPGLTTIRPADANEVVEAWKVILPMRHEPVCLALTRQAVPTIDRTKYAAADGLKRGAYVLADAPGGKPDVLLLASGSEVSLCVEAHEKLKAEGIQARVISLPSWELFEQHCAKHPEYREQVMPEAVKARVSVEQASPFGWERYVGRAGQSIAMRTFGASAPIKDLQKRFGFTTDAVMAAAREQVKKHRLYPLAAFNQVGPMSSVPSSDGLAAAALAMVPDGATVGLGSGRAATAFVRGLAERVQQGLKVRCVPTSQAISDLAAQLGIPLISLNEVETLDLAFDGADEVDPQGDLIKGYGGALVREKIVAASARQVVILVGAEKLVPVLGTRGKLPIEVVPFGWSLVQRRLQSMGFDSELRQREGQPLVTDNGNFILNVRVPPLPHPAMTDQAILAIPGVVGTGIFLGLTDTVLIQHADRVEVRE